MTGWFRVSTGQLRENSPEQREFSVNYTLRVNVRDVCNGKRSVSRKSIINVLIEAQKGQAFDDGTYFLEENGRTLLRVERANFAWHALCPGCMPESWQQHGDGEKETSCASRQKACPNSCIHSTRTYCPVIRGMKP